MRLGRGVRAAMFARSFAIQGSWNYRTLVGTGLAFTLLPALRRIYAGQPERLDDAVRRHAGLFNTHPYLAPMATGAIASMEAAGEDPVVIERFKQAVRGSLGTLGDQLVWATWRPVCLLLALAVLLLGGPWWLGVTSFLVIYNAGHFLLRGWSFAIGLADGKSVGERLRRSPISAWRVPLGTVGAFLVGLLVPLAAAGAAVGTPLPRGWVVAAAAAGVAGVVRGARIRRATAFALSAFALLGLLLNTLQ